MISMVSTVNLSETRDPVFWTSCPLTLNLLAMTEKHIHPIDNDSLLNSITLVRFMLCHRPYPYGLGGAIGCFVNHNMQFKIVNSRTGTSFECTLLFP